MRILQIANHMYPHFGGIEQVARDIIGVLKEHESVEQKVICFNDDAQDDVVKCSKNQTVSDSVDGIEIVRCGYIVKISSQAISMTYPKVLRKTLDQFRPDIIIFHYPNPYAAHFLLKHFKGNFKLILYWHSDIVKQKFLGRIFHLQNKRLLKYAAKIVATSPNYIDGSRYLREYREKCMVIPNCVQNEKLKITPEALRKADEIKQKYSDKIICFTIGRHVEYKGLSYLIGASKYLKDNIKILIGGNGPLTESLKKEAYADDKIEFLGRLSDSEMIAYFLACDIYCFPSITKNEAFGIALAEGMYFGKPAVTFTIPGSGVNYVNLDGVTGIECPNGDSKADAEALQKLANDQELREKYGSAARQRVSDNFTVDIFKMKLMNLIDEIR